MTKSFWNSETMGAVSGTINGYERALVRSQMLLTQFEQYFDSPTVAQVPNWALALLVGVFP
ncbi:MAG TPA: hypothetical protein VK211_19200 [Kamptonema sp.]|nr:hypothetical protein [Kamptonema sp.]